jgi:hypothetical protein
MPVGHIADNDIEIALRLEIDNNAGNFAYGFG